MKIMNSVKILEQIRIVGNIVAVSGYFVMLHINPIIGVVVKVIGLGCVIPFCIKLKMWDVVAVMSFFMAIDISYAARHGIS